MARTISIRPIQETILEFLDGTKLKMKFDVQAMMHFEDEEIGGIDALAKIKNQPEVCAIILYVGTVSNAQDMTLKKARELVSQMDIATISEIIKIFMEDTGSTNNEVMEKLQKKTMMEFLQNLAKQK